MARCGIEFYAGLLRLDLTSINPPESEDGWHAGGRIGRWSNRSRRRRRVFVRARVKVV